MKFGKKTKVGFSKALLWLSVLSVVFAGLGAIGTDIWLASTQWLLVAAVSILFAMYLKMT